MSSMTKSVYSENIDLRNFFLKNHLGISQVFKLLGWLQKILPGFSVHSHNDIDFAQFTYL